MCVVTRHRPQELRRLLSSLSGLKFTHRSAPHVSVFVIDNSASGELVGRDGEFSMLAALPTTVVHEPTQGIPIARNRALDVAVPVSDYIAFVDDDETVTAGWLDELLLASDSYGAHITAGPTVAAFADTVDPRLARPEFFERPRHPTGTTLRACSTCNVLMQAEVFRDSRFRFDPRLRFSGGSDTELFRRVSDAGYTILWVDQAEVIDHVPSERVTVGWLVRRRFRNGNVEGNEVRRAHGMVSRAAAALARKAVTWLLSGLGRAVLAALPGSSHPVDGLRRAAWGVGAILGLGGYRFGEYRGPRPRW